eukprot:jgi/Tetstr1/445675/TSEL_003480.t1
MASACSCRPWSCQHHAASATLRPNRIVRRVPACLPHNEASYLLHRRRQSKGSLERGNSCEVASRPSGTDEWDAAKVLDLLTTSLTAITYNCEGKIRLFAEFCIDEEGISPP